MKFDQPEQCEAICYQLRLGDYPRGKNRALINNLFNGVPPYEDEEVEANGIEVNVNFLESTRLGHEARTQFYQAFQKPGAYFSCSTDVGAPHKRATYNQTVTKEIAKVMKKSIPYMETLRSKFALDVLHGIAPTGWKDPHSWMPDSLGVEDVLVPANTLLTMVNLPFFAIKRSFTAPELIKLTRGPRVDPAWNKDLVESIIKTVDKESIALMGTNWPEIWSPEKMQERVKGDGGFYVSDSVPVISVFDFFFWSDYGDQAGWRRRMILDSWSAPTGDGSALSDNDTWKDYRGQFLYNSDERIFASQLSNIINWQFADLSAVAPFRYHSVRSLGFLLYSVCHLQNRMRCKFNESVFEQMLIYFRVKSQEDAQRVMKVDMVNRGFIDDTVEFVKAADRYQVNAPLVEMGLNENRNLIAQNSSSYTSQMANANRSNVEKTKFEVMSEVNAMTSLVSASLQQAYFYQVPEYREIFRRFTLKDSKDPQVRDFQAACIRKGVPDKILYNASCWELEPERVMGAGNKTLEMAIAQQLMEYRNLYDPESQRQILHDVTLAITDDPGRADDLVPPTVAPITDSVHDAQLAAGTLMQGLPVAVKSGMNHIEYVDTLLMTLATVIQQPTKSMQRVTGMQMMGQNIAEHISIIGQNPEEGQRVKMYQDQLGKLMNAVKQLADILQKEQAESGMGEDDGQAAETQAKVKAMMIQAKAKAEQGSKSHAQKTAQRQIQFEMEEKRKQQQFEFELRRTKIEEQQKLALAKAESSVDENITEMEAVNEEQLRIKEREAELEHQKEMDAQKLEAQKKQAKAQAKAAASKPKPKPKK